METLLNNNRQDGETILVPQGWYNHIDVVSQYTAANIKNDDAQHAALSQQHKDTLKAQKDALVPFVAQRRHMLRMKPHLEPFMMGKLLVPGVQFSIQFYMNAPELIFDAVTIQGKIREIKMKMYLCVVRLNDTIFRSLMSKIFEGEKHPECPITMNVMELVHLLQENKKGARHMRLLNKERKREKVRENKRRSCEKETLEKTIENERAIRLRNKLYRKYHLSRNDETWEREDSEGRAFAEGWGTTVSRLPFSRPGRGTTFQSFSV